MKPIVTLSINPSIDGASETEIVRPIRKMRTTNERYDPGGGGINVARVIQELGGRLTAVYIAGGVTGSVLERLVTDCGIDGRRINSAGHTRISHVVFERSTGKEYRFVPEGPQVSEPEWRSSLDQLETLDCDYLVASGSLARGVPTDFYVRVGEIARRKNARFVLDTSGPALRQTLAAGGVHLVKPSRGEFEELLGEKLPDRKALKNAALSFVRSTDVELLVVSMGREGALLAHSEGVEWQEPLDVPVRSAVGAGDSFVAAMTLGLAQGMPRSKAFMFGAAAGTAAVLTPGTEMSRRSDVERIFAELQARADQIRTQQ